MKTTVKELMKPDPVIISADSSLKEAAQKMSAVDCGVLPVGSGNNIEGIITDRDIVIRAVAQGKDPSRERVRDYMTTDVQYCDEDDTLEQAAEQMRKKQVSRLVVKGDAGEACGIITFGCILRKECDLQEIGKVIECAVGKKAA